MKNAFENASFGALLFRFSLGILAGLVFNGLYTLSDVLILSYGVGKHAVAAVSLVMPFTLLQGGVSTAIGAGAATLVSPAVGRKDLQAGGRIARTARVAFWAVALLITAVGLLLRTPILKLLGATPDLFDQAQRYLTVLLIGNVFSTGFSSIIRAEGHLKYGVLIWVIPITLNLLLDALFVFGCKWGVEGSAWATVICQMTSCAMSLFFFARLSSLQRGGVRPDAHTLKEILLAGVPSLAQSASLSVLLALLNHLIAGEGGTQSVTAFSYAFRVVTFAILPLTALSQGLLPVMGYLIGAGRQEAAKKGAIATLLVGALLGALTAAAMAAGAKLWMGLLTRDGATVQEGARLVRICACALPFLSTPMLLGAACQAGGQRGRALLLYLLPAICVAAVAVWSTRVWGVAGAVWGFVGAAAGATALSPLFALPVGRKRNGAG